MNATGLKSALTEDLQAQLRTMLDEKTGPAWLVDAISAEIASRQTKRRDSGDAEGQGKGARRYGG